MSYFPQQTDFEILRQPKRVVYSKVELLNSNFKNTGQLEGELITDNYSIDANSDIRRTYNITLHVKDSSFLIGSDRKIWIGKYLRVSIGLYHLRSKSFVWYPVGIYSYSDVGYSYNANTKTLTLSCLDRMSQLTGELGGQISGLETTIAAGISIREAIMNTVVQFGKIEKYRIDDICKTVPYDLEFGTGSFVYDIVKELRDLYPGWETFFDGEYFICQPYPTCTTDPIVLDSKTINPLVINENTNVKLNSIKNVVEVWGKCLDTDSYTASVTCVSGVYKAIYEDVAELSDGLMLGFKACSDNLAGSYFKVNDFKSYPILCENNEDIPPNNIETGSSYVLKFVSDGAYSYFHFYGQYQISAIAKLVSAIPTEEKINLDLSKSPTPNITYVVNANSPFCCDLEGIGELRQVLCGGDYDNIYSEDLAMQRAKYELWKSTDLLDTITLDMVEIPWLDVNQKIEYTSNALGSTNTYIVKTKSGSSMQGTMTITCTKFQPLYSWT